MSTYTFFIILFLLFFVRIKPKGTIYIIDRKTHYLKTVKNLIYFFNPLTDKITTKISKNPIYTSYTNYYETEDGKTCNVSFSITYFTDNIEDVLYSLDKTRRSIDDILQGSMYYAVLSLKQKELSLATLYQEFLRNIESQALPLCIKVKDCKILNLACYSVQKSYCFTPHKSRSLSNDYDPIK